MNRREFLRKAGQITLGSLVAPSCLTSLWEPSPVRPNILLIISDDQHYWSMSDMLKTRGWLEPGLTFNNNFCTTPLCAPSRASIMTGKRVGSGRLGVGHEIGTNANASWRYRNRGYQHADVGWWLKNEAGYNTSYIGKFLNGYDRVAAWEPPAYDNWIGYLGNRDPMRWNRNGTVRKTTTARKNEAATTASQVASFIQGATEPWFCIAASDVPHSPADPSNSHATDYAGVAFPTRPNFDAHDPNKPPRVSDIPPLSDAEKSDITSNWRGKMRELMDLDDAIDSICSGIDFDDTYVFLTSDNGYMLGEHRLEHKGHPYEESIRVPLLVRGPGMRENATSDLMAANIDLAPTILELAGLDPTTHGCDGRSLVGPMFDETSESEPDSWRESLYFEYRSDLIPVAGHWEAVRTNDAVYIERESGFQEYYDLAADPYQLANLAPSTDPVTLYEMSGRLAGLRTASGEDLRTTESTTTV